MKTQLGDSLARLIGGQLTAGNNLVLALPNQRHRAGLDPKGNCRLRHIDRGRRCGLGSEVGNKLFWRHRDTQNKPTVFSCQAAHLSF